MSASGSTFSSWRHLTSSQGKTPVRRRRNPTFQAGHVHVETGPLVRRKSRHDCHGENPTTGSRRELFSSWIYRRNGSQRRPQQWTHTILRKYNTTRSYSSSSYLNLISFFVSRSLARSERPHAARSITYKRSARSAIERAFICTWMAPMRAARSFVTSFESMQLV
jgi:hypothetical protein